MKKIISLLLVLVLMMSFAVTALATDTDDESDTVTITVTRDSTYAGEADAAGRVYTWYKIFSATYTDSISSNASGYENDGSATIDAGGAEGISYIATAAVAEKMGSWVPATGTPGEDGYVAAHWDAGTTGNEWFDLTPIAGSTSFTVSWRDGVTVTADTMQAAAAWLIENEAYEASGSMTFNDDSSSWTAEVDKGYYVIASDVGDNLIAATTDITINEKNDYPPIDKTQADEDDSTQSDDERSVAVGDTIDYEVKVTIPKTAAVGDTIVVYDTPSAGLEYNNDVTVSSNEGNATVSAGTAGTGEAWRYTITVTEGSQGKDVVFSFSCTVTDDALTDTERQNEAQLEYGNNYTSLPDAVTYTTYFTGVHKIDGSNATTKMAGVKFTLKEDGEEFKVSKTADGYYIPDAEGSSEVVTDENGYILIRGLDDDKTYTLTETETLPGYNMLDGDVTLILVEDTPAVDDDPDTEADEAKAASFASYDPDSYQDVENKQGTLLPSTGGIGTTIFYVIGGLLVLGATVVLVTKKRIED